MHQLTERQQDILFAAISEYIRTGEPVSSEDLRTRYRFQYSPATIRHELLASSEAGYLTQPHTSAGRTPTDTGYRWYVDKIAHSHRKGREERVPAARELPKISRDADEFFRLSTEMFSHLAQALVVGGMIDDREPLHKSGFGRILSDPEFTDPDVRNSFGALMDALDNEMRELANHHDFSLPRVFIGSENPIREARPYSMIVRTMSHGGNQGVFAIIGSKRMRYGRGLALMRALDDLFR